MTTKEHVYRVIEVVKISDGDTYWLRVSVGFRGNFLVNVRLSGYDCPERTKGSQFERDQARVATAAAVDFFKLMNAPGCSLWVRTDPDPDDFGRWLGDVWLESDGDMWPERHLGAELRSHGLASVWPTRWRDEFDVKA